MSADDWLSWIGPTVSWDPTELPRVLTRADAIALGYSTNAIDHLLRSGQWRRVLPRTYLTRDTFTALDRRRAALAFVGHGAVLSGAAGLVDLRLRSVTPSTSVLTLAPITTRCRSTGFVRVRPTRRLPARALRPGPACASTARAVADHALGLGRRDDVRALLTEVIRRELCTVDELCVELEEGPRQGSAHLRRAVEDIAHGAWSVPEAHAGRLLRAGRVPPFEQNARLDLPGGGWLVADFLWRELRAVLEIDSDVHHGMPWDAADTSDRHLTLETMGFSVVHRTPRYLATNPREFVTGVAAWLAGRASVINSR